MLVPLAAVITSAAVALPTLAVAVPIFKLDVLFVLTVTVWPVASKTALTVTSLLFEGITNVVVVLFAFAKVMFVGETDSQRTNLNPVAGVAVSVTVWPFIAAPVLGTAVPIVMLLVLFVVTLTALPGSKTACTVTAEFGIVNDAFEENLFVILAFDIPATACQCESA